MTYWLRATTYAIVSCGGGQESAVLYPGEALRYDGSPQHDAVVADLQAGRPAPVELVECEVDPSTPPPPDRPRELAAARAQLADATERIRQANDPTWERAEQEAAEHADAAREYAQQIRALERRLRAESIEADEARDRAAHTEIGGI